VGVRVRSGEGALDLSLCGLARTGEGGREDGAGLDVGAAEGVVGDCDDVGLSAGYGVGSGVGGARMLTEEPVMTTVPEQPPPATQYPERPSAHGPHPPLTTKIPEADAV
jgi:hypothetical protein